MSISDYDAKRSERPLSPDLGPSRGPRAALRGALAGLPYDEQLAVVTPQAMRSDAKIQRQAESNASDEGPTCSTPKEPLAECRDDPSYGELVVTIQSLVAEMEAFEARCRAEMPDLRAQTSYRLSRLAAVADAAMSRVTRWFDVEREFALLEAFALSAGSRLLEASSGAGLSTLASIPAGPIGLFLGFMASEVLALIGSGGRNRDLSRYLEQSRIYGEIEASARSEIVREILTVGTSISYDLGSLDGALQVLVLGDEEGEGLALRHSLEDLQDLLEDVRQGAEGGVRVPPTQPEREVAQAREWLDTSSRYLEMFVERCDELPGLVQAVSDCLAQAFETLRNEYIRWLAGDDATVHVMGYFEGEPMGPMRSGTVRLTFNVLLLGETYVSTYSSQVQDFLACLRWSAVPEVGLGVSFAIVGKDDSLLMLRQLPGGTRTIGFTRGESTLAEYAGAHPAVAWQRSREAMLWDFASVLWDELDRHVLYGTISYPTTE